MKRSTIYDKSQWAKTLFLLLALSMVGLFLYFSNDLVRKLSREERGKMEIWAAATRELASGGEAADMNLILQIIQSNNTIPVIIADHEGEVKQWVNIELPKKETEKFLHEEYERLREKGNMIEIILDENLSQYLYYDDSILLKRLSYYPYVQLGVMALFLLISYLALTSAKRAEQNKVWVGLSKETAHQLGTPISSLMAWVDLLQLNGVEESLLEDMRKDVYRLKVIADRFSKIGSCPDRTRVNVAELLDSSLGYMRARVSNKVQIALHAPDSQNLEYRLSVPLFEWVIENLCKNAIDAMDGAGKIDVYLHQEPKHLVIDVVDTGKGIEKKHFKSIFSPGFTTKQRGWGLGLTLVKRIVEEYHQGRIFVKESVVNRGTTITLQFPRPKETN